jgi:hypothetical protein
MKMAKVKIKKRTGKRVEVTMLFCERLDTVLRIYMYEKIENFIP